MDSIGLRWRVATVKRVCKYIRYQKLRELDPRYQPLAQMAGSYWTIEETKALLGIWGAANLQAQLNVVCRKKVVYERVSTALRELGYEHTWEQCKIKIKNLIQKYKKVSYKCSQSKL